jgi:hypothetical protein
MGATTLPSLPHIARQVEAIIGKQEQFEERLQGCETQIGSIVREVSLTRQAATDAREESKASHQISRRILDEFLQMKSAQEAGFLRIERECDIRHAPVDRRLNRLEDKNDAMFEGEITKIQDRDDLVKRAKGAEFRYKAALIGAITAAITTFGAIVTAILTR